MLYGLRTQLRQLYDRCIVSLLLLMASPCFANLPTPPDDSGGDASKGNWLGYIKSNGIDALKLLILILGGGSVVVVVYIIIHKFLEAKETRSWGEFGTTVVVGCVLIAFIGWLLTYAGEAITD